jgi:hypothetical protein
VADYRAYKVGSDGHFVGYEPMICANDQEAIAKAQGMVGDRDIELWCGERLVIVLKAQGNHAQDTL